MEKLVYDLVIVGSGAGGATLACELSRKGNLRIAVIEAGKYVTEVGSFQRALKFFDADPLTMLPASTKEGIILWRALMAGGSTVAALANQVPSSEVILKSLGIDLSPFWQEIEQEMGILPLGQHLISEGSRALTQAGKRLGVDFRPMPKAIAAEKCVHCAVCPTGCPYDAKWTALRDVDAAVNGGVDFYYDTRVQRIVIKDGSVSGIHAVNTQGEVWFEAQQVVLAAGGIGSAQILLRSGVESAGKSLFMDVFQTVAGVSDHMNLLNEPSMAMLCDQFHVSDGFILSPYIPVHRLVAFAEFGLRGLALPRKKMIGLMVKTKDDMQGEVRADGTISKVLTEADWKRLNTGTAIAKNILAEAGATPASLLVSRPQGAHPGGTAAIGTVVDEHLRVNGVENLFVCDASVLPEAPGLPPIMTIVALAKWFARSEILA